jgi:glyoxylase-like metal-dependent hydrolase (beta-lactamase superfamily II)
VLIDCAQERVLNECTIKGLTPKYVLLTHGHYDHIGGCGALFEEGAKIMCGEKEKSLIFSDDNRAIFHGITLPYFEIDKTLKDGEEIELCGMNFKVLHTPGHTAGGVSYICEDNLFTGDTLFCESVGRCDLPTGNARQLVESVKKLYSLSGDYKVYCGHEEDTTLSHERAFNPYVRG